MATYEISVVCSTPIQDTEFVVEIDGQKLRGTAKETSGWYDYRTLSAGRVELTPDADIQVAVRSANPATWKAVNIRSIELNDVN